MLREYLLRTCPLPGVITEKLEDFFRGAVLSHLSDIELVYIDTAALYLGLGFNIQV
jgi:hypothetical protein